MIADRGRDRARPRPHSRNGSECIVVAWPEQGELIVVPGVRVHCLREQRNRMREGGRVREVRTHGSNGRETETGSR